MVDNNIAMLTEADRIKKMTEDARIEAMRVENEKEELGKAWFESEYSSSFKHLIEEVARNHETTVNIAVMTSEQRRFATAGFKSMGFEAHWKHGYDCNRHGCQCKDFVVVVDWE